MAQVVKPKAAQVGGLSECTPGRVPLLRRLGRVELVVVVRTPNVVVWVRVPENVGPAQHALNGRFRRLIQWDRPLARLVLAAGDVQHAFAGRAFDVPDLFEIDVPPTYMLHLY